LVGKISLNDLPSAASAWLTRPTSSVKAPPGANAATLVAGAGMYLLLTCVTRYVQTPGAAGYGFGLDAFTAGLRAARAPRPTLQVC